MRSGLKIVPFVAVLVGALVWGDVTAAQSAGAEPSKVYAVIAIGDEIQVIDSAELRELKLRVAEKNREELERWNEAKKEASKNKAEFSEQRPVPRMVNVIKNGIKSAEQAEVIRDREMAKRVPTSERFIIVQVGDKFEIIRKKDLAALKKRVAEAHKTQQEEYKAAKKDKASGDVKRPRKPRVKPLPKSFSNEAEAETHLAALREKKSKKKRGTTKS